MKIIRNGIEYELTFSEMVASYWENQQLSLIEDIKCKMEEMEIDPDSVDINTILIRARRAIDNDDCLWDSYWRDIEYAIEEEIRLRSMEE